MRNSRSEKKLKIMNIHQCTQRAESPGFNSVGHRPTKGNGAWSLGCVPTDRALPYPNAYALSGQIANNFGLCVYKANGNLGATTDWADAVNNCANGSYADGDAFAGWYLPNLMELMAIYLALGGSGKDANPAGSDFTYIQTPSYVATTAEPMVLGTYWSSTSRQWVGSGFSFNNGVYVGSSTKSYNSQVRCVKRM